MRILLVGFVTVTALSGCAQFNADMARKQQAAVQRVAANDDATCRSYGAAQGSQAYIACRMQLQQQHANADAQDKAAYQQWWQQTFGKRQQQNCTTTYVGNIAQTHCY